MSGVEGRVPEGHDVSDEIPPIDVSAVGPARWISEVAHWKARAQIAEKDLQGRMDLVARYRLAHLAALSRAAPEGQDR